MERKGTPRSAVLTLALASTAAPAPALEPPQPARTECTRPHRAALCMRPRHQRTAPPCRALHKVAPRRTRRRIWPLRRVAQAAPWRWQGARPRAWGRRAAAPPPSNPSAVRPPGSSAASAPACPKSRKDEVEGGRRSASRTLPGGPPAGRAVTAAAGRARRRAARPPAGGERVPLLACPPHATAAWPPHASAGPAVRRCGLAAARSPPSACLPFAARTLAGPRAHSASHAARCPPGGTRRGALAKAGCGAGHRALLRSPPPCAHARTAPAAHAGEGDGGRPCGRGEVPAATRATEWPRTQGRAAGAKGVAASLTPAPGWASGAAGRDRVRE
ncbi:translation initiation factor IF-2-like [Panicum virgatum]|uniref:translation initiation factor IF-2-like n=1 Tax=Panicum virgatum TaxID=38727 RepID=UPI0019D56D8C|nr:translation initiation factor IF-2-like [Panicum virgatum]